MRYCPTCRLVYTGEQQFCPRDGARLVEAPSTARIHSPVAFIFRAYAGPPSSTLEVEGNVGARAIELRGRRADGTNQWHATLRGARYRRCLELLAATELELFAQPPLGGGCSLTLTDAAGQSATGPPSNESAWQTWFASVYPQRGLAGLLQRLLGR